jgi:DNA-binding NarL/FixJ family response regulator
VSDTIRILIADDHSLFREGVRQVLSGDPAFEVVAETGNGREVLPLIAQCAPDVALLDISMPGATGLELAAAIREQRLPVRVIMLSVHDHAEYVLESARVGAHGYLRKDTSPIELRGAIHAVAAGESFFSPAIANRLTEMVRGDVSRDEMAVRFERLTPREREVLAGIVDGDTNKEIAAAMGISPRTVETHRESLMHKLGIRSVAGLTRFAVASGLIRPQADPPSSS